jgi:hypothetical protein
MVVDCGRLTDEQRVKLQQPAGVLTRDQFRCNALVRRRLDDLLQRRIIGRRQVALVRIVQNRQIVPHRSPSGTMDATTSKVFRGGLRNK